MQAFSVLTSTIPKTKPAETLDTNGIQVSKARSNKYYRTKYHIKHVFLSNDNDSNLEECSLGFISSFTGQINKFIWNRITIVVDWKRSLPQIIAAVIGSGLIVTAFSAISPIIVRPIVDISVHPDPPYSNQTMTYIISLKNILTY